MQALKPSFSIVDLTQTGLTGEQLEQFFITPEGQDRWGVKFSETVTLPDDTQPTMRHNIVFRPFTADEDEPAMEDGNFQRALASTFDMFPDAFSEEDNLHEQMNFMSRFMLLCRNPHDMFGEIETIYGSMLLTSSIDDEEAAFSLATFIKSDDRIWALIYVHNELISMTAEGTIVTPTVDIESYAHFSRNQLLTIFIQVGNMKFGWENRVSDGENNTYTVQRDEYFTVLYPDDNLNVFRFSKIVYNMMFDVDEDQGAFYRVLKPSKLFTVDDIVSSTPLDTLYLNNEDISSTIEAMTEESDSLEWIEENGLIEAIDEFQLEKQDSSPDTDDPIDYHAIEGLTICYAKKEGQPFDDIDVIVEASLFSVAGVAGYIPVVTDNPVGMLHQHIKEMYDKVTDKVGNLRLHKNQYIQLEDNEGVIQTSLGTVDITQMPVWFVLLGLPFANYLHQVLDRDCDLSYAAEDGEEFSNWFELQVFTDAVQYLIGLTGPNAGQHLH